MPGQEDEPSATSIRALFDLPRYDLVRVERWAGWGRLTLVPRSTTARCPKCHSTASIGYCCRWRVLRDLDIGRRHVELRVPVHRASCAECGRPELPLTLARPYARCTRRLEQHLFHLTRDSTVKAVAVRLCLDWETVKDAEVRHIRGLLRKRNRDGIRRIGIDEVSYEKGHKYLTLVTDLDHHRVVFVTHGNDGAAVRRFLKWLGPDRCRKLRVVVTDMHDPYLYVLHKHLPWVALVFDHFHVSKVVHNALDLIRRRVQRQLPPADRRIIKGQRYVLLRPLNKLTQKQRVSLQEILDANTDLTVGHILKEEFRNVFTASNRRTGKKLLRVWAQHVRESGIPEFLDALKTIDHRRRGIENYFQYHVANGMAEGFNNVVGTIKKQAYGFHDRDYLKLKILRICGKLE